MDGLRKGTLAVLVAASAIACGRAPGGDGASAPAPNGAPRSTPTEAPGPAAAARSARPVPWSIAVEGGEHVIDLPDDEGLVLIPLKIGHVMQFAGAGKVARLDVSLPVEGPLEAKTYQRGVKLVVNWSGASAQCVSAPDLTVTVTSVDPIEAHYAGPISCHSLRDSGTTFEATASGVLNARAPKTR
jgi:hypothetical protein